MELITKAPKGTVDIVPGKSEKWQVVEDVFRSEAELNGFGEVRTPVFEHTELFQRGVGDTTDVVEKQMYTFEDKGGRSITLRPEGTAGAVRAMLENGLYNAGYPVKLYYLTSCYRYEKPQAGRLRELHQFGVEMFGAAEPVADAQIIAMALSAFKRLGLEDVGLQLNSIGCPECRKEYHKALKEYFTARKDQLCDTCLSRLERNPMRILDCKSPECQEVCKGAPKITDYLCEDCKAHFQKVQDYLTALGVEFEIDPGLVRGLDYYTRTVFEFPSKSLGFALGGGNELAMSCDIRLCSENAVFGQPEVGLGITPGFGGTQRLARLVGMGMAKQLVYSALNIKADEALRIGLVNAVYPQEELLPAALKLAGKIAKNAPIAVRNCKKAINDGISLPIEKAVEVEEKLFGDCFETHDQVEGMGCFLSREKPKPKPVFTNN